MRTLISNGRVIDPASSFDQIADIGILDGKIAFIGKIPEGFVADEQIDASSLVVCPGLVDISARLREPGLESKAAMKTELKAASAGGITGLAVPPDTDPMLDEPGLVRMLKHRAQRLNSSRVYPLGALTVGLKGEKITEMGELHQAGCRAFSHGDMPLVNTVVLFRSMQYASTFSFPVWLRPQDPFLAHSGIAHEGPFSTLRGLPSIPPAAELIALYTYLEIAKETQTRLHLQQISSKKSLDLIRQAKAEGLPITCDVSIHHLHLYDEDIGFYNSNCVVFPPLRGKEDREALRAAVMDGTIDVICSDHAPVDEDDKAVPFAESMPGMTALEVLLPLTLKWAEEMGMALPAALSAVTCRPAAVLGVEGGRIEAGKPADLCLFDPEKEWIPSAETLYSLGKNTPFIGSVLKGKVLRTLVGGETIYQNG